MPGLGTVKKTVNVGKSIATNGWRMIGSLGAHTKGALLVGAGTIGGWKYLSTGKLPLQESFDNVGNTVNKTTEAVENIAVGAEKATGALANATEKISDMVNDVTNSLSGGGSPAGEATDLGTGLGTGGSGGNLLGNLFNGIGNLFGGLFNGGTGKLLGLVAGAFMLFGNFGWMGKIGGLLLGALSLGLFGGNRQQQSVVQQQPAVAPHREQGPYIQPDNYPNLDMSQDEGGGYTVHRSR